MSSYGRSWNSTNQDRRRTTFDSFQNIDNQRSSSGGSKQQRDRSRSPVSRNNVNGSEERGRRPEEGRWKDGSEKIGEGSSSIKLSSFSNETQNDDYELQTEEDEERQLEERRKRRLEILKKFESEQKQSSIIAPSTTTATPEVLVDNTTNSAKSPSTLDISNADGEIVLGKDVEDPSKVLPTQQLSGMSAADYDPDLDRAQDGERLKGKELQHQQMIDTLDENDSEYEEIEVEVDEEIDDIFAIGESDTPKKKIIRVKKEKRKTDEESKKVSDLDSTTIPVAPATLLDNWDDADGYYKVTLGERIGEGGRFQLFANLGRGMFSAVVRARDAQQNDREVAIKIIRSQESMFKAGKKEISILQKLLELDPDDRRHVVRLLGHFEHRNHLCMVFESLNMNLREVIRRFGKDVGLNLRAVRTYAHQMFLALALMRKAEIMHADLKPDNILVNENKNSIKVCDLGSASSISEMEITPYLVSRFYRAPEIILGLPYDCALDMWSIGCTLFELYSGRILFPGKSNNHMLMLMQEVKGKFTIKQIRKGRFSGLHFDDQNAFVSREKDRNTGNDVLRKVVNFNPTQAGTDLRSRLLPTQSIKGMSQADIRLTNSFIDLLGRTLELDPARRITPTQALQHPFFSG